MKHEAVILMCLTVLRERVTLAIKGVMLMGSTIELHMTAYIH